MKIRMGAAALWIAAAATASAQVEGVADFKITMKGEDRQAVTGTGKTYVGKGGWRSQWEMDLSHLSRDRRDGSAAAPQRFKMTMLGKRSDLDHFYMINDDNKTYTVTDLKKLREDTKDLSTKQTYTVQRLGGDTVAGLSCQKASATSSRGEVFEVCISRDWIGSGEWIAAMSRNQNQGSFFAALRENGLEGFPVRMAVRRKAGEDPFMVMEFTHVEKRSVPASLFEVPAGYKQADSAIGGLTPEQDKAMRDARAQLKDALEKMTPEERKAYEDAMKRYAVPTPSR